MRINKNYQKVKGREIITSPKTKKSNRVVKIPQFLADEIKDYMKCFYDLKPDQRLFYKSKGYLGHEITRGSKKAGIKRINIHALRHPYVKPTTKKFASFLKFFRAAAIAARSCSIRYSWLMLPFQISPFLKSPA